MIRWFEVENFKSLKKLHLEMRPFMVLVGANGAGKTNIVQALSFFLEALRKHNLECIELYGGYDQAIRRGARPAQNLRLGLSVSYRDLLEGSEQTMESRATIGSGADGTAVLKHEEIKITQEGHPEPLQVQWSNGEFIRVDPGLEEEGVMRGPKEAYTKLARNFGPQLLPASSFFSPPDTLYLYQSHHLRLDASSIRADALVSKKQEYMSTLSSTGEGLPLAVERLRGKGKTPSKRFKRILLTLAEVYPNIEDVSTVRFQPGRVALSFKERNVSAPLGEGNVSDGALHALALLVALEEHQGRLLIIEEPENALHPWALRRILEHMQERPISREVSSRGSILITTHSPIVVDAVKDPASLFIVERDEKRGTVVSPAVEKERTLGVILKETGQKLGDVWLGGSLGGVPGA